MVRERERVWKDMCTVFEVVAMALYVQITDGGEVVVCLLYWHTNGLREYNFFFDLTEGNQ